MNGNVPPRDPAASCFGLFLALLVAASVRVPDPDWVRTVSLRPGRPDDAQEIRPKSVTQECGPARLRTPSPGLAPPQRHLVSRAASSVLPAFAGAAAGSPGAREAGAGRDCRDLRAQPAPGAPRSRDQGPPRSNSVT